MLFSLFSPEEMGPYMTGFHKQLLSGMILQEPPVLDLVDVVKGCKNTEHFSKTKSWFKIPETIEPGFSNPQRKPKTLKSSKQICRASNTQIPHSEGPECNFSVSRATPSHHPFRTMGFYKKPIHFWGTPK